MIEGLLCIISLYGLGILSVHLAHYSVVQRHNLGEPTHYILHSNHSQSQIEWSIRSLLLLAWLRGEALRITVIDHGSTDDTLAILDKLAYQDCADIIHVIHAQQHQPEMS